MASEIVAVRLPKEIVDALRRKYGSTSAAIRKIVERAVRRDVALEELQRIRVRWKRRPKRSIVEILREDRDVLH